MSGIGQSFVGAGILSQENQEIRAVYKYHQISRFFHGYGNLMVPHQVAAPVPISRAMVVAHHIQTLAKIPHPWLRISTNSHLGAAKAGYGWIVSTRNVTKIWIKDL